jgi:predicted cupin superfamily sugar epimerase
MHARVKTLIETLQLQPHPEGGWYRETFRSPQAVRREADGALRGGLTTIFFLLAGDGISRWHRVRSDEAWHHYEGGPLELLSFAPDGTQATSVRLGADVASRMHVVPASWWQAARPCGDYALVGCSVGPGFDFADFALLGDLPAAERPPPPSLPEFARFL